ncbi:hypothetical protein CPB86DRAFT_847562 [Serendipita vermifera]|nr:hypothetical protein CPB86DRAFT_847562 [Serendipita vermifera]
MQFGPGDVNWPEYLNLPDERNHLEDPHWPLGHPSFSLDSSLPSSLVEHSRSFNTTPEGSPPPMNAHRNQIETSTTYGAPNLLSMPRWVIYEHFFTSASNSPASRTVSLGSEDSNSNEPAIDLDLYLVSEPSLATFVSGASSGGTNNHTSLPSINTTIGTTTMQTTITNEKTQSIQTEPVADEPKTRGSPAPKSTPTSRPSPIHPASPSPIPSGDIRTIATVAKGHVPNDAVFCDSNVELIRSKCQLLLQRLRNQRLSGSVRHPYMTCPVFDCERGGWNPLLHGEYPEGLEPPETGHFFTANEIVRHVKTKHTPENDLRCHHPGCKAQAKLDARTVDKKGRFSRRDVLRKHYKDYPDHKESVPEELRRKYKLFRLEAPALPYHPVYIPSLPYSTGRVECPSP